MAGGHKACKICYGPPKSDYTTWLSPALEVSPAHSNERSRDLYISPRSQLSFPFSEFGSGSLPRNNPEEGHQYTT